MASEASGDDATGIYEPLMPPYHPLTDTNKGVVLMVVSIPVLVVSTLIVAVKLWTVYGITRKLGLSEVAIVFSVIFAIGYTVCINEAIVHGLGTAPEALDDAQLTAMSKNYFASNILLVMSIACAKASVVLLFITVVGWKTMWKVIRYTSQVLLGITLLWGIASPIALGLQCSPTRWVLGPTDDSTCVDQHALQIGIRVIDVITDLAVVALPILLMTTVQTSMRNRLLVVVLFGIRIITPIPNIISMVALSNFYDAPLDERPYAAITPAIWTSMWLCLSIITACIPSIKQFIANWAAGLAAAAVNDEVPLQFTMKSRSGNNTGYQNSQRGSHLASKLGFSRSGNTEVTSTHGATRDRDERDTTPAGQTPRGQQKRADDTSDSVRGLTDGMILQTKDYTVEYDDMEMASLEHDRDGSTRSSGTEKGHNSVLRSRS